MIDYILIRRWQNAEFVNFENGGTYNYHCVLSVQERRISEGQ
jgi:hypothetical protein